MSSSVLLLGWIVLCVGVALAEASRAPHPDTPWRPMDPIEIKTWEDCDAALGRIRRVEASLAGVDAEYDAKIQELEEAKGKASEGLRREKVAVAAAVLDFVAEHGAELPKDKRSIKLVHGRVGLRSTPARTVFERGEAYALEALRVLGKDDCIVSTREISKDQVKKLKPEELKAAGIKITQDETVFYELEKNPVVDYPSVAAK